MNIIKKPIERMNQMKKINRIISMLITVCMVVCIFSITASAETTDTLSSTEFVTLSNNIQEYTGALPRTVNSYGIKSVKAMPVLIDGDQYYYNSNYYSSATSSSTYGNVLLNLNISKNVQNFATANNTNAWLVEISFVVSGSNLYTYNLYDGGSLLSTNSLTNGAYVYTVKYFTDDFTSSKKYEIVINHGVNSGIGTLSCGGHMTKS